MLWSNLSRYKLKKRSSIWTQKYYTFSLHNHWKNWLMIKLATHLNMHILQFAYQTILFPGYNMSHLYWFEMHYTPNPLCFHIFDEMWMQMGSYIMHPTMYPIYHKYKIFIPILNNFMSSLPIPFYYIHNSESSMFSWDTVYPTILPCYSIHITPRKKRCTDPSTLSLIKCFK